MTFIVDGTNGLTFPNSTVQASSGQVLQVVQANYDTKVTNATTTFADSGLTATITPKFSTSKILVLVNQNGVNKIGTNQNSCVGIAVFRGSTNITSINASLGYNYSANNMYTACGINYLDSPATTSATTYKTQFKNADNNTAVYVQDGGVSTITLLEIAA